MKLPNDLALKLREPLPREAIKPHPTKPYLSSINSIYVTERLNDVFGVGGWKLKVNVLDQSQKMVTVQVTFTVPEYGVELEQFGGHDNVDKGDALKGATTDALTKIGSYLGIGQDVWKDKKTQQQSSPTPEQNQPSTPNYNATPKAPAKRLTNEEVVALLESGEIYELKKGKSAKGFAWFGVKVADVMAFISEDNYNLLMREAPRPSSHEPLPEFN